MNIKRNDPCPCGSGKKYKKCCGLKEAEMRQRSHNFSKLPGGGNNPVVSFANKIIKVIESEDRYVPPANVPESQASTEEAATPELTPPRKIRPGLK